MGQGRRSCIIFRVGRRKRGPGGCQFEKGILYKIRQDPKFTGADEKEINLFHRASG